MDGILKKFLRNSTVLNELIKSDEGANIVSKLISLNNDIEMLPEMKKLEFQSEFLRQFDEALNRFHTNTNNRDTTGFPQEYCTWIILCVIFAAVCKSPT